MQRLLEAKFILLVCTTLSVFRGVGRADSLKLTIRIQSQILRKPGFADTPLVLAECLRTKPSTRGPMSRSGGTMVLLHGRGGENSLSDLIQSLSVTACKHGLRLAAPAAPTQNKNWPFESMQGEGQDSFLLQVVQQDIPKLFKLNPKDYETQPLILIGVSAGATFLMGGFYPRHGHQLKGAALALCGGSAPTQSTITGLKSLESKFPLFVKIGRSDFLFGQVKAGLSRYAELGLPLRAIFADGQGHCAFDFNETIEQMLKFINK